MISNGSNLLATLPTQLALSFFGILHVPINIPALAVSTQQDVDTNGEIIGHGFSNLISGFIGAPQVRLHRNSRRRIILYIPILCCIYAVEAIVV